MSEKLPDNIVSLKSEEAVLWSVSKGDTKTSATGYQLGITYQGCDTVRAMIQ